MHPAAICAERPDEQPRPVDERPPNDRENAGKRLRRERNRPVAENDGRRPVHGSQKRKEPADGREKEAGRAMRRTRSGIDLTELAEELQDFADIEEIAALTEKHKASHATQ